MNLLDVRPVVETLAPGGRPGDCRVYERTSCQLSTKCQPASLLAMMEAGWSATIRDISQGGIRIHLSRRFEKGTPLAVELPGDTDQDKSIVFAKVVHIKALEDGMWALGCKFVSDLSEDELQRLLTFDQALAAGIEPPQQKPVVAENPPIVANTILTNAHFQIHIRQGCQFSCLIKRFNATKCWPLVAGKIVRLSGNDKDQTNWSFKVQIVNCLPQADRWSLQAKLLQTPSQTELLQAMGSFRTGN